MKEVSALDVFVIEMGHLGCWDEHLRKYHLHQHFRANRFGVEVRLYEIRLHSGCMSCVL